ncbi:recombinase family protein [Sulfoacidibacillus thermotolerans]|uniref:Resolvase n=1 Tax=Sulfoacidibacillus thermotolerans TaxID=1765684 RepID=A0A2U3D9Z6_SULT2|nr:recombinase family protein [Sulfoacidibacillus thermotolerans]PWI58082.1 resolvase [Sulfoacidibacillus thermotolerans]
MALQEQRLTRVAIYCRVSTDEQAKEGVSLEEQRTRLIAYCRAMGWNVEIVEFIDDGYSAKDLDRPALTRLLREVRAGTIEKLMVTKLDRLSRRLLDLLTLIDLFHDHQVAFVSTSEAFDTDTPAGRLTLQVLGAVAEFERERIRERVFENMLHAAKSGRWLTQHPYGYRLVEKQLVVYEPEAQVVRRVFRMFWEQGLGYLAIAKQLNKEAIPSRQNKQWSVRAIKLLLTNPAYRGTLVWNRVDSSTKTRRVRDEEDWVVLPNSHPALIDQELWDHVQQRILHNQVSPTAPRAKTSPHLLGGFLFCGQCGSSMAIGWSGGATRYRVYRCSGYANKGTCQSTSYRADEVEKWFKEGIDQLLQDVDRTYIQVEIKKVCDAAEARRKQQMEAAKRRYQRQVEAYTAGLIELADLQREKIALERYEAEAHELQEKRLDTLEDGTFARILEQKARNAICALEQLPMDVAKAKLRTFIDKVVLLGREEMEIHLHLVLRGNEQNHRSMRI